jgi:hypothetical protein
VVVVMTTNEMGWIRQDRFAGKRWLPYAEFCEAPLEEVALGLAASWRFLG